MDTSAENPISISSPELDMVLELVVLLSPVDVLLEIIVVNL